MTLDISMFTTPSPERPPVPVPVDWAVVEEWLGLALPGEYKRLADRYGPVEVGDFLTVHVPCEAGDFDYAEWLREMRREARVAAEELPEEERPALHPAPGGLLPWGCSTGGDVLFWDTSRSVDPDEWTVVVLHQGVIPGSGLLPWHPYDLSLTGYLRHTVREAWETPSPPGPLMGPLPGIVARPDELVDAGPWTPPEPVPPRLTEAERRIALETGTGLDALRLLAPPPAEPFLGGGTWEELFAELGTRLPREYVELLEVYGAGIFSEWLRLHTPLRTGERRFATLAEEILDGYRQLRDGFAEDFLLPVRPEPGGFLPFANSIDGDYLGWLTEGPDPDAWPLVFWPRHAAQGPPLAGGLVETLLAWQRGRLVTPGLAVLDEEDEDPLDFAGFRGWDERAYW
ncbi:SMI1/KNR4 family protein [Streptomyces sp. NPDC001595]|uniref:SMI1/KNR4 family protein n=1 Tax=Streptomyces sp. NPDC001532 TaxID=3154520 RepID=UPI003333A561